MLTKSDLFLCVIVDCCWFLGQIIVTIWLVAPFVLRNENEMNLWEEIKYNREDPFTYHRHCLSLKYQKMSSDPRYIDL